MVLHGAWWTLSLRRDFQSSEHLPSSGKTFLKNLILLIRGLSFVFRWWCCSTRFCLASAELPLAAVWESALFHPPPLVSVVSLVPYCHCLCCQGHWGLAALVFTWGLCIQGPIFFPVTMVGEWSREPGHRFLSCVTQVVRSAGVAVSGVEARVAGTFETGGIELQDPPTTAVQCPMATGTTVARRLEPFACPPLTLPGSLELGAQLLQQGVQNRRHSLCCPLALPSLWVQPTHL